MTDPADSTAELLVRLGNGDVTALEALFSRMRDRLRRTVRFRLDPRLAGRIDEDDVLQEAWLAAAQRIDTFRTEDETEVFVWLRRIVGQTMIDLHRRHLGAKRRTAGDEVRLGERLPHASSAALSKMLVASLTSPSGAAMRAETNAKLIEAIDAMDPEDREIVVLRHFEEASNDEVAAILGLTRSTASYRYMRALAGLKRALGQGDS